MLEPILESARKRAHAVADGEHDLRRRAAEAAPPRDFASALVADGLQIVAEIKRRSPSAGDLAPRLDPGARARQYVRGGAAAVSVLTEPEFFGGALEDLRAVSESVAVPVLRKDFLVHPAQVWEARAWGADAVLLIVAALTAEELEATLGAARSAGVAALVEAHTEPEVASALAAGAEIIGVNNRDLRTFATDIGVAESLAGSLGAASVRLAESGVSSGEGARRMASAGYDAILVGEAVVRASDPAGFVAGLREAAS